MSHPPSRPPFTVRDLGEVAIRCRDLAAMTAFYRDVIGLEEIEGDYRPTIRFLRVAPGFAGHTQVIGLFGPSDDPEAPAPEDAASTLHHLALAVLPGDLDKALAWYRAQGLSPTTAEHPWIGWSSVYVTDPEGNTVELVAATGPGPAPRPAG
jgi:catechol 2,3-dioxygenase-like lactoylglutathione lyase family enzyme